MSTKPKEDDFSDLEALRVEVEDFNLEKPMGSGAYGVVYEVTVNGKRCIAKKLHKILLHAVKHYSTRQDDIVIVRNFRNECRIHSQLNHPNVVRFIGISYGHDKMDISLIMEKLHCDLADFVMKNPEAPLRDRLHILHDVSKGISYLHSQNPSLIHRDLTAPNVLLTEDLTAKIGDLGVSRYIDPSKASKLTTAPGSFSYMPPECKVANPSYTTKLDIFSFGNLIIHTLNGDIPDVHDLYSDPNLGQYVREKNVEVMRRSQAIHKKMSNSHCLYSLVLQCLSDEPEKRPSVRTVRVSLNSLCIRSRRDSLDEKTGNIVEDAHVKPFKQERIAAAERRLSVETPIEFQTDPLIQGLDSADEKLLAFYSSWSDDARDLSPNMYVKANKVTVCRKPVAKSSDLAQGKRGFQNGLHYWMIIWHGPKLGSNAVVGVCTEMAEVRRDGYCSLLGMNRESWGWDLSTNTLRHKGQKDKREYAVTLKEEVLLGRSIGVHLDMNKRTLEFDLDGNMLGIAFSNLPSVRLYPAISAVYGNTEVSLVYRLPSEHRLLTETPIEFRTDPLIQQLDTAQNKLIAYYSSWSEDAKDHSPNIYVKANKVTIHRNPVANSSDLARGKKGFSSGVHHWTIVWHGPKLGTNAVVGVCTEMAEVCCHGYHPLLGKDGESWGWDLSTSVLRHNGKDEGKYIELKEVAIGRSIGVTLNMDDQTLAFDLDGNNLGIAFRNLPKVKLYPAISAVYGNTEVSLVYGSPLNIQ